MVEGPSEKLLFEWVLDTLGCDRTDIIVQSIAGIYFDKYSQILKGLGIKIIIKTDNDIAKVSRKGELTALGFNRCIDLFNLLCDCEEKEKLDNVALGPNASESTILETKF